MATTEQGGGAKREFFQETAIGGVSEGTLRDKDGTFYAHATATCFRCKQTTARQPKGETKMVRIGIIACANMTNDLVCSSVGCLEDS